MHTRRTKSPRRLAWSARASIIGEQTLTDGSKIPHEKSFLPIVADLRHEPISHHDAWNATKQQYQKTQEDQSWERDASRLGHVKLLPGHCSAEEGERSKVQDGFDDRVEGVVSRLGLSMVHPIPIQSASRDEAGERFVRAKAATSAHDKKLEVDVSLPFQSQALGYSPRWQLGTSRNILCQSTSYTIR